MSWMREFVCACGMDSHHPPTQSTHVSPTPCSKKKKKKKRKREGEGGEDGHHGKGAAAGAGGGGGEEEPLLEVSQLFYW